ncbi:MAG: D-alanyl-D-alanine dipeptidase [Proteobacteria bacterium]|nr:D-alanyl-D-alanine dipeptidase [Pseudomonadota bacterium]
MKLLLAFFGFFAFFAGAANESALIDAKKYDFSLVLDIRYATENNFTHKKVYPEARCVLRKAVAEALSRVQAYVKLHGYRLKVYDCYRPLSVQKKFWELVPDEKYVADPNKGSKHNRGAAVDVTLIDASGQEVEMPSGYDDFTEKAHRNYQKASKKALSHRRILESAMEREGFQGLDSEWWHFDFKGWEQYSIEDVPLSSIP